MLCNTVVRIGMYAKRDLKVGEELFFNYGYPKEATKGFWEKGQSNSTAYNRKPPAQAVTVKSKKDKFASTSLTAASASATTTLKKTSVPTSRLTSAAHQPKAGDARPRKKGVAAPRPVRSIQERRAQTARARAVRLNALQASRSSNPAASISRPKRDRGCSSTVGEEQASMDGAARRSNEEGDEDDDEDEESEDEEYVEEEEIDEFDVPVSDEDAEGGADDDEDESEESDFDEEGDDVGRLGRRGSMREGSNTRTRSKSKSSGRRGGARIGAGRKRKRSDD